MPTTSDILCLLALLSVDSCEFRSSKSGSSQSIRNCRQCRCSWKGPHTLSQISAFGSYWWGTIRGRLKGEEAEVASLAFCRAERLVRGPWSSQETIGSRRESRGEHKSHGHAAHSRLCRRNADSVLLAPTQMPHLQSRMQSKLGMEDGVTECGRGPSRWKDSGSAGGVEIGIRGRSSCSCITSGHTSRLARSIT